MQTVTPLRSVQYKWLGSQFIVYIAQLILAVKSDFWIFSLKPYAASNHSLMSALFTKAMKKQNLIFNTNKPNALFSTSSARFSEEQSRAQAWLSSMGVLSGCLWLPGVQMKCVVPICFSLTVWWRRARCIHTAGGGLDRGIGSRDATAVIGAPRSRPWYHLYHLEMAHLGMGLAGIRRDPTACHLNEFAQLRGMNFLCGENA